VTPLLTDAHEIVSEAWAPWLDAPGIATPADWRFAAQCAVDGDPADLTLYLGQLNGEIELPNEPPKWADCAAAVERWKSQTKEPAVEAAGSVRSLAA
jgi:hypothetical protein